MYVKKLFYKPQFLKILTLHFIKFLLIMPRKIERSYALVII